MEYLSVAEIAKLWQLSERSVRNYCRQGRVEGARLAGRSWQIPAEAVRPVRCSEGAAQDVLAVLRSEKQRRVSGGLYHRLQVDMTYNSNHIEGSTLTHDQTRYIFETNSVAGGEAGVLKVDDIVETANHFRCIDLVIENAMMPLSEHFIKRLHEVLKSGTEDSRKSWFAVGGYKRVKNFIGGVTATVAPGEVSVQVARLLSEYGVKRHHSFEELVDFHYRFERIHPFQDGNGRVGRLILLKECLRDGIVPFIVEDEDKYYYYLGLREYGEGSCERLRAVFLHAQDRFRLLLQMFGIGKM